MKQYLRELHIGDQGQPYSASHSNQGWSYGWQMLRETSDSTGPAGVTNIRSALSAQQAKLTLGAGSYSFEVNGLYREVKAEGFTVEAKEFIGDGSKLTNLPTGPDIDLDEYARLDGADFTGRVRVGTYVFVNGLRVTADALPMADHQAAIYR